MTLHGIKIVKIGWLAEHQNHGQPIFRLKLICMTLLCCGCVGVMAGLNTHFYVELHVESDHHISFLIRNSKIRYKVQILLKNRLFQSDGQNMRNICDKFRWNNADDNLTGYLRMITSIFCVYVNCIMQVLYCKWKTVLFRVGFRELCLFCPHFALITLYFQSIIEYV